MANAAARWSFCGSSTFFAFVVSLLCLSSVVAASGHSIVLQKRNPPRHQLAVRGTESVVTDFRTTTIATQFTTITDSIAVTTTTTGAGASVTPEPSLPISGSKSPALSSFQPDSKGSSASIQSTPRPHSISFTASSSPSSTPSRGSQRPSGSTESSAPSSYADLLMLKNFRR